MVLDGVPKVPLSDDHGIDRGTPIVRVYIEEFLGQHREAIRGSVLEVGDSGYTASFGTGRVTTSTVVDIDATNREATLIADLNASSALPDESFDCIILTEVLHLLKSPGTCLRSCHRALREEGSLLITVPALKRLNPKDPDSDYLRYTPAGLELLLRRAWDGPFSVTWYGNLRACVAFLVSHVSEEIGSEELRFRDKRFPLTVAARAEKQRRLT
ncbi:MAG: class I SAM-dependent methyltransferase [Streptosporangiaceae bacterium]